MRRLHWIAGLLLLATACDRDESSDHVRESYKDRHQDTFVFHADRAAILHGLDTILADRGLTLTTATGDTITTTMSAGMGRESLSIHLIKSLDGYLVHIVTVRHDETGAVYNSDRDTAAEWELAQRVEPDRALAILNDANTRADKVAPASRRVHVP